MTDCFPFRMVLLSSRRAVRGCIRSHNDCGKLLFLLIVKRVSSVHQHSVAATAAPVPPCFVVLFSRVPQAVSLLTQTTIPSWAARSTVATGVFPVKGSGRLFFDNRVSLWPRLARPKPRRIMCCRCGAGASACLGADLSLCPRGWPKPTRATGVL